MSPVWEPESPSPPTVDERSVNLLVRSTVMVSSPCRPSRLTVYHMVSSEATTSEKPPVTPPS